MTWESLRALVLFFPEVGLVVLLARLTMDWNWPNVPELHLNHSGMPLIWGFGQKNEFLESKFSTTSTIYRIKPI